MCNSTVFLHNAPGSEADGSVGRSQIRLRCRGASSIRGSRRLLWPISGYNDEPLDIHIHPEMEVGIVLSGEERTGTAANVA